MPAHIWFKNRRVYNIYTSHLEACAENRADDALHDVYGEAARYHALDEQLSADKAAAEDDVPFRIDIPAGLVEPAETTLENLIECQEGDSRADDPDYEYDVFEGDVVISKGTKPPYYDDLASAVFDVVSYVWTIEEKPQENLLAQNHQAALETGLKIWDAIHRSWREGYSFRNWTINAINYLRDTDTATHKLPEWTL